MQGKTINGFTLKFLLGKGGMAEVWYAENEIGMKAAVKIMSEELSHNTQMQERFLNEAKVMVKLDHPNIRKVYGYGNIDGRPGIIMEYLDGSDLKSRMKQGQRFTEAELERWWNQLVYALNYTHTQNVVHRDIKPSNIFIDGKGDVKLLDFGIAKVADTTSGTMTGSTLGTRIYMSPEQVKDPKHVGPKSDVYSLAVSFVHLLTGKAPYDSTTSSDYDIQVSIVTKPIDMDMVPDAWRNFLTPYLNKEPDMRPALRHFEAMTTPPKTVEDEETKVEQSVSPDVDEGTIVDEGPKPEPKPAPKTQPKLIETKAKPSQPSDKPKKKVGLWVGLGLGVAAVVVVLLGIILSKSLTNKSTNGSYFICEVSSKDVVRALSNDSQDPTFLEALELASIGQWLNGYEVDFVTLFGESYEYVDPNAKLASIFLYEFKDKGINVHSSNDDVLRVLKSEYDAVVDRSCQIMQTRLQRFCDQEQTLFGKIKFDMKKMDDSRIRVDFPNNTFNDAQLMSIRKMMNTQGSLGFYETYKGDEICQCFDEANAKLAQNIDNSFEGVDVGYLSDEEAMAVFQAMNPLHAVLQVICYTKEVGGDASYASVGIAQVKDTAAINQMLAETKDCFPRNLKLAWTAKPLTLFGAGDNGEDIEALDLVALKVSQSGGPALGGEVITKATQEFNSSYNMPEISIEMNQEGKAAWKRLTGNNIGRQIAIVFDGYVYSYPVVNAEIPNGRSTISGGGMTVEDAKDLAIILSAGALPVPTNLIEEGIVP